MRWPHILALVCIPAAAAAQSDDRSFLTAFLEDNLSGAGRTVTITGFEGALSSRASLTQMTIADDQGIWLTLNNVTLDWSRSALLSGRVEVNELSAKDIILDRLPATSAPATPAPEAGGFSLPELPVSVNIGQIAAAHIKLGADVLGEGIEGRLDASVSLSGGEGQGALVLERTDTGPSGRIALTAGFANATRQLSVDLDATEGAGGVASRLIGLPGTPSVALTIKGAGPLDDFAADVRLATDGVERLGGAVTIKGASDGGTGFDANLSGDLAPLFLPQYAAFFGPQISLSTSGQRAASGQLRLDALTLKARAIALDGSLALASDGLPQRFDLTGRIGLPDGAPVLLPLTGPETRINGADVSLSYDATKGEGWRGRAAINGFDREGFAADRLELTGSGRIARGADGTVFGATLGFDAAGLIPDDPGVAQALGPAVTGSAILYWQEGSDGLRLPRLVLSGQDYSLSAGGRIDGLSDAFRLTGQMRAQVGDLTRLSILAGRPLRGAADIALDGTGSPLGGDFDLSATVTGQDLAGGQAELDQLLRGQSQIAASVRRDTNGTQIDSLTLTTGSLSATAKGQISSTASELTATLDFTDLSNLGPSYGGALAGTAHMTGSMAAGRLTLDATGRDMTIGQAEADRLLRGQTALSVDLSLKDGKLQIDKADLSNPQVTASATGTVTEARRKIDLVARLADLAMLVPDFPGALSVEGSATDDDAGYALDLRGQGPGQIDARVTGRLATDLARGDLTIAGTAQAGLANAFLGGRIVSGPLRFDLGLAGPLAVSSLTGRISLSDGRLADPGLPFALQGLAATANLGGGVARLDAKTQLTSGGQVAVAGTVGLASPFAADLTAQLAAAVLRDPQLYQTTANGQITVKGPLTGGATIAGRVLLGQTEVRIPSTGLGGGATIPDLKHVAEPADVHASRIRAGLLATAKTGGGGARPFGMNITVDAPNQLFIRGRGLDAELGGQLVLRGTTADIRPAGAFTLIRGRLDILGKRLDLTEATLLLEGNFIPTVAVAASNESDGITSSIRIDGPATDPKVSFASSPPMPEEEVLARLLFGRGIQNLSALQAAQLANAVATLAGKGGDGIVGRLRSGFGLDDLDVQTGETGGATLRAGKYLSKNLYSEVTVGQAGESQINLNLDLSKSITLRGTAGSDGKTGIGVFLQKDY
jgi:translocation and assembly module TamB